MPASPPIVFAPPSPMSGGAAPTTVFSTPEAGSPATPIAIHIPPTLGGATTAPPGVMADATVPAPTSPPPVAADATVPEPSAPSEIFVPALPEADGSFTYQDYEFPARDGTYANLGRIAEGALVFAKAGGTIAISAGVISGGGMMFIQRWVGDGYSWTLESSADFASLSPGTLITQTTPSPNREEYPTPVDVPSWLGDGFEGNEFAWQGAVAPSAVFSGGDIGTPSVPPTVLIPPSTELVPDARPTVVYRPATLSADAELDSDGSPILDSDGYEVRDSTG